MKKEVENRIKLPEQRKIILITDFQDKSLGCPKWFTHAGRARQIQGRLKSSFIGYSSCAFMK